MAALRAVALCSVLLTGPCAPPLADDFESGHLLFGESPPGAWTQLVPVRPGVDAGLSAGSAHPGDAGFRVEDYDNFSSSTAVSTLNYTMVANDAGYYFVRAWPRISNTNASGGAAVVEVVASSGPPSISLAAIGVRDGGRELRAHSETAQLSGASARAMSTAQWSSSIWR